MELKLRYQYQDIIMCTVQPHCGSFIQVPQLVSSLSVSTLPFSFGVLRACDLGPRVALS